MAGGPTTGTTTEAADNDWVDEIDESSFNASLSLLSVLVVEQLVGFPRHQFALEVLWLLEVRWLRRLLPRCLEKIQRSVPPIRLVTVAPS